MFEKRLERAKKLQREQRGLTGTEESAENLSQELEKGDMFAMLVASLFTLVLPAALILIALALFACFLFGVI